MDFSKYFDNDDIGSYSEVEELVKKYEQSQQQQIPAFFDVDDYLDIIEYYAAKKQDKKADQALGQAKQLYPDSTEIKFREASILFDRQRYKKSLAVLATIPQNDIVRADAAVVAADCLYMQQRYDESNQELEVALNNAKNLRCATKRDVLLRKAINYESMDDAQTAIKILQDTITKYPTQAHTELNRLYRICYADTLYARVGIVFFEQYLKKHPYSIIVWQYLADLYEITEQYGQAIEACDYILAMDDTYNPAYHTKASCFFDMNMYDEARALFETMLKYAPDDVEVQYNIVLCHLRKGEYEEAEVKLKQIISEREKRNESTSEYYCDLCDIYTKTNRQRAALKAIELAKAQANLSQNETSSFWSSIYERAAHCYEELGYVENAIDDAKMAAALSGREHADTTLYASELIFKYDDPAEAIVYLLTYEDNFDEGERAYIFARLAIYLCRVGNVMLAVTYLDHALSMNIESAAAFICYAPELLSIPEVLDTMRQNGIEGDE